MNSLSSERGGNAKELCVVLDGLVLGTIGADDAEWFTDQLRSLKVLGKRGVSKTMEVAYFPYKWSYEGPFKQLVNVRSGPYPGVYLSTAAARMIRPVWHRSLDKGKY